ncbi:hypothetical protein G9A89_021328 [Geosiphon pyriformis]|nr:hypothetical protein G9A89_021328 [Geosiphon pyriformis]
MRPTENNMYETDDADTIRGDSSDGSAYCDSNNKRKRGGGSDDGFGSSSSGLSEPPTDTSDTDYEQKKTKALSPIKSIRSPANMPVKRGRGRPKKDQSLIHTPKVTRGQRGRIPNPKPAPITIPNRKVGRAKRKSLDPEDVKATDRAGQTNLHIACQKNKLDLVKDLVLRGADINAKDNGDWTPLHEAAYAGHIEIVEFLLENGAFVNAVDYQGDTPLHDACYEDHPKVVKLLLEYGADAEKTNDKHKYPIDVIKSDEVKGLLNTPVDEPKTPRVNTQPPITPSLSVAFGSLNTNEPSSPTIKKPTRSKSHREEGQKMRFSTRNQRAAVPNDALRLEPRFQDKETGRTHLHNHAKRGRVQEISLLLETCANPNAKDHDGRTPLHDAAFEGHFDAVQVLLAFKGDPNIEDRTKKNTPLHEAARKGHVTIVDLLLQAGAQPNLKNLEGITPLNIAKSEEVKIIIKRFLTEKGISLDEESEKKMNSRPSPKSPRSIKSLNGGNSGNEDFMILDFDVGKHKTNGNNGRNGQNNGIENFRLSSPIKITPKNGRSKVHGKVGTYRGIYQMDLEYDEDDESDEETPTPTRIATTRTTAARFTAKRNSSSHTSTPRTSESSKVIPLPSSPSSTQTKKTTDNNNSNFDPPSAPTKATSFKLPAKFQTKISNSCMIQPEE